MLRLLLCTIYSRIATPNAKSITQGETMKTLEEIKAALEDSNLKTVAAKSGVHYNALYRLMREQVNPSYETVKKLSDYLEGR